MTQLRRLHFGHLFTSKPLKILINYPDFNLFASTLKKGKSMWKYMDTSAHRMFIMLLNFELKQFSIFAKTVGHIYQ